MILVALFILLLAQRSAAADSVQDLISQMTLNEKCKMLSGTTNIRGYSGYLNGIDRLGIPGLAMNDGPQGFRGIKGTSTAWPCAIALAATFHPQLVHDVAKATGKEFRGKGANVFLGPGMNLARIPTCGRNFEYICGEDPLLGEIMASQYIKGIQSNVGLLATAKHFVNNEQETNRNIVNSIVDEHTNWNLYYRPFLASVRVGNVAAVMCSYNLINGKYACENEQALNQHLKRGMGFQGIVMSDWFATMSTKASALAGMDIEMPFPMYFGSALRKLVETNEMNISVVNEKVERILRTMHRFNVQFGSPLTVKANVTSVAHNKLARYAAASSVVLLKNAEHILPLHTEKLTHLVLLGDGAKDKVLYAGGGSGHVNPAYVVSPFEALHNVLHHDLVEIKYHSTSDAMGLKSLPHNATVLVFVGTSSTETKDRPTLGLDDKQLKLVDQAIQLSKKVVVCVTAPGAVLLPFYDQVQAITLQFMPGQAVGDGLADVLFGIVDPGGARLPVTLPRKDNETEMSLGQFPGITLQTNYTEKLDIGYRFYSRHKHITPQLPFGFGMSYAAIKYLGAKYEVHMLSHALVVKVGLANMEWKRLLSGTTVVQVYVTKYPVLAGLHLPTALVGFTRVELRPFEIKTAEIKVHLREHENALSPLAIWRVGKYHVFPGRYKFAVGPNSAEQWHEFDVQIL